MSTIPEDRPASKLAPRLASVMYLAGVAMVTFWSQRPPAALPADAPIDVFSAARAMRHVAAIARESHPLGSPAEEPVRAYLMGELQALGLEPEIQRPRGAPEELPAPGSARSLQDVRNIVARWRGSGPPGKQALLLSAHYDSVSEGPGAADDASGVAAILESLRAMETRVLPERDVIILFNDGEEAGLYGAIVFADEHPWAKDVGVALNLDARGNSGPVYMFETSQSNGWLIEQLARALPHPITTSLAGDVYALMGNDTDLTIYKQRGMSGLNFAFIAGVRYYHSVDDTPENLDVRTLQHQGESLLAVARHFADLDLDNPRRPNLVYFSLFNYLLLYYPAEWAIPLFWCAVVAYAIVAAFGMARRRIRFVEILFGFAVFLVAMLAALIAVALVWLGARSIPGASTLPWLRFDIPILTGLSLLASLIVWLIIRTAARRWSWEGLGLGILAWWLALSGLSSYLLPGASYAFVLPLLAILAGQAVCFAMPRGRPIPLVAACLGATPLTVIFATIMPAVFLALNLTMAIPLMIPVVLIAAALVPLAGQLIRPEPRTAPPVSPESTSAGLASQD